MKKAIKNALNNSLKGASSEENSESSNSSERYHPYKRTKPTCGRCRIHGTKGITLEGHKNYCKYRNCDCIKCHIFQQRRKLFATTIAMKRMDELDAKKKILPDEVPLSPLFFANKKCDLYILLDYSLKEMYKFASILSNSAIWDILIILKNYGEELDKGVKSDGLLENAKTCVFRATIIRHLKIIRRDIAQNIILSFIIIYLMYVSFSFKYYLFPP